MHHLVVVERQSLTPKVIGKLKDKVSKLADILALLYQRTVV